jgi:hypothetical protein
LIRPEPLAELDEWLAPYRELWATVRLPKSGRPQSRKVEVSSGNA